MPVSYLWCLLESGVAAGWAETRRVGDEEEVCGRGVEHFRLPWEAKGLALRLTSFSFLPT